MEKWERKIRQEWEDKINEELKEEKEQWRINHINSLYKDLMNDEIYHTRRLKYELKGQKEGCLLFLIGILALALLFYFGIL